MAQNNDYWAKRFARLKQQEMQKADQTNVQLLKEYTKALQKLRTDVIGWYERYARENNMSYADAQKELTARELKAFKLDLEEYVKLASDQKLSQKYRQLLDKASIRARLTRSEELYIRSLRYVEELAKKTNTSLEKLLPDVYKDSVYKSAYETQRMHGQFETFAQVDDKTANAVIKKPWASDGQDFSQRIWKDRENLASTLQREMSFSFTAKEGVDPLTERIAKRFRVSYNNARRLVETETAYVQEKGMLDTYDDLGIDQYQIVAVLDSRTSEICQNLDGKIFDRKDAKPGLTMPPFHCNCRSTTVPYILGVTDDEGETMAIRKNEDGKTKFVNARLTYQQWEKKYLKPAPKSTPKPAPAPKPKTKQDMINNIIANAKKIGFSDVQSAVTKKLNVELIEPITEWINKLEDKFGVVKQATDVRFCVGNSRKRAVASVHFKWIDPTNEEYTFSPKYFNKSVKEYSDLLDSWSKSNWHMPCAKENVKFYTATHEYGHMLQNMMILQAMKDKGWTAKDPGAFINWKGITANSRFKWYKKIINSIQNKARMEIIDIAKKNNPSFNMNDNLSLYGKTNNAEFFAEVFANSQCGDPNELGKAMNEWLKQKGLIKNGN